jgi:hypothetical protein
MPEFHHAINCYIELDGRWRFKDDPEWGERLYRFREGRPTLADIRTINDVCHVYVKPPPANIQVATFFNRNRDAVNAAVFEDWCRKNRPQDDSFLKPAVLVLMDHLEMTNSRKAYIPVTSNQVKRHFYENCGEDDCKLPKMSRGRVDPVLKLYPDCPMMYTKNNDVLNGQANGSRVRVKKVKTKPGEEPTVLKLDCGTKVRVLLSSQVESILVEHEAEDISPRTFHVNSESWKFSTSLKCGTEDLHVSMKGKQFPIISNSCTTGHKLQGCSVEDILINDFHYQVNWPYVVLSRVRTMKGLYLRECLSEDLNKY